MIYAIRDALAAEEFEKAERLWNEYADRLARAIQAGEATAGLMAEAAELVKFARQAERVFSAHCSERLRCARTEARYTADSRAGASRPHLWA